MGEGSAKINAITPGVTCQAADWAQTKGTPLPWDHDLNMSPPTIRVKTKKKPYFILGEPVALLERRRVTGRTKSHTVNKSKLKLPFIRLYQIKLWVKAGNYKHELGNPTVLAWVQAFPLMSVVTQGKLPNISKPVGLKSWPLDQQHQHHLGTCWKCTFSGLTPHLQNQEFGGKTRNLF